MTTKAIITKYATTKGPILLEGEAVGTKDETFRTFGDINAGVYRGFFHRYEWHTDKRSATDDVLDRFAKKQASLKNQLAALQAKRDRALKAIEGMELP